jgi:hypothetical protein
MSLLNDIYAREMGRKESGYYSGGKEEENPAAAEDARLYNATLQYMLQNLSNKNAGINDGDPGVPDVVVADQGGTSVYPTGLTPQSAKTAKATITVLQQLNDLFNPVPIVKPGLTKIGNMAKDAITKSTINTNTWAIPTTYNFSDEEALQSMARYGQSLSEDPYSGYEAQMQAIVLSYTSGLDVDTVSSLLGMGLSPDSINSISTTNDSVPSPDAGYYGMGGSGLFGDGTDGFGIGGVAPGDPGGSGTSD